MKFKAKELRQLTFPKGLIGYRKKDVDDCLLVISKDYFEYEQQLHKMATAQAELEAERESLQKQIAAQEAELQVVKKEGTEYDQTTSSAISSVRAVYGEELHTYSLAQQVALSIEEEAKAEYIKKMTEAKAYYAQQVAQIEKKKTAVCQERASLAKQLTTLNEQFSAAIQLLETMNSSEEGA